MLRSSTSPCERICRVAFLRKNTVVILQHIDEGFKELSLLVTQRELFFKLFDSLFWCQR